MGLGLDLTGLLGVATDAGQVAAVIQLTNGIKGWIEERFEDRLNRLYPILPFVAAAGLCILNSGLVIDWAWAKCTGLYGMAALTSWNLHRVTIQNK